MIETKEWQLTRPYKKSDRIYLSNLARNIEKESDRYVTLD